MHSPSFSRRKNYARLILHRLVGYWVDWSAFALSGFLAFELRFDFVLPAHYLHPMVVALGVWILAKAAAFIVGKLDRGGWRYTSAYDAVQIVLANAAGSILGGLVLLYLLGPHGIPRSVYILDWLLSCLVTLGRGFRCACLSLSHGRKQRVGGERIRTLIYGAGSAGLALLWELRQNDALMCDVIGLIDDDPSKGRLILQGKRVLGSGRGSGRFGAQVRHQTAC